MDIYQVPEREEKKRESVLYLRALIVILLAIGIILILRAIGAPIPALLLLPAVLIVGLQWGRRLALFTAILSSLAYIVLFSTIRTEPNVDAFIHFVEILVVAILVATLAGRSHRHVLDARRRQRLQRALRRLSHELAAAGGMQEVANATVETLLEQLGIQSALFVQRERESILLAKSSEAVPDVLQSFKVIGEQESGANSMNPLGFDRNFFFYPLQSAGKTIGHLGLLFPDDIEDSIPEQQALTGALTVTITAALEREMLAEKSVEADLLRRHEELYNAVLSSISHDFRTPLATIIGAAETLSISEGVLSRVAKQDMLDMIREEAERLNRFVANLLDMTKLEADRLNPNFEQVDVSDIIGTAINRAHRTLEESTVEVSIAPDLPMIYVDFILIEHVMTNLLENSVKYNPEHGTIQITAEAKGEIVEVSVIDQGKGIPESELDRVFEKFYRVRQGDARTAGTGLGLSICRGIVEAHGGTIRAFSPVYDEKGTRITLSLPAVKPLGNRSQPEQALSDVEKE